MQFKYSSLVKLVKNLSDNDFKYLMEELGSKTLELLKQEDPYPYEYMDSFKRFNKENLPDKKCFHSSVKDGTTGDDGKKLYGHISDEDYLRGNKIWNEFSMINMGDYHDYYLKKDVLLLADVFEKFIDTCLKFYRVDPCHYFSSPGLSWNVMLKMIGVRLEKFVDIDMYLFIEKGLKGGISYIAKRISKVNNKYMKNYGPKKPSRYISYLDINNLHGWVICSYLPYGRFKWLKNVDDFDVNSISKNNLVVYFLEVDLDYPNELHVLHSDYPLAPEKLAILYDMLSDYCGKLLTNMG